MNVDGADDDGADDDVADDDVAVVITTFDHARFLATAITSALDQTHAPAEVVVVDDGSRDRPEAVVAAFPTVRLIRQENRGPSAARNTGWRAISAPFVTFLDADDRLLPRAIEANLARLGEHPDAPFAYGAYVDVHPDGTRRPQAVRPADGLAAFLEGNVVGMHAAVLYRTDRLAAAGGFPEDLRGCEEYDLYLRLSRTARPVYGDEAVAEYLHHGSNTSNDTALMLHDALRVMARHRSAAAAAGCLNEWEAGVRGWKRFYAVAWWERLRRAATDRRVPAGLWAEGLSVARAAPGAWVAAPLRPSVQRCRRAASRAHRRWLPR